MASPALGATTDVEADEADTIRREVARAVVGRADADTPAGLRRWAERLLRSRTDWRRVLAAEVRRGLAWTAGAVDYDSSRPSRRQSVLGPVALPALGRPVPHLAVIVDTSASMRDDDLARALAEVDAVIRATGVTSAGLPVLACDAQVHVVRRVASARHVRLEGGGGTDMGAGIDAARALRPRPQLLVVLTDGYTPWPDAPPRRTRVVVGLIGDDGETPVPPPPAWARTVQIEVA
jgi:predicted metal-dependent peptidase